MFKNKIKDKSAQALPEFALCLPLIVLMIGILITVGQMVYAKEVLQAAAQSFCREFVVSFDENMAKKKAEAIMNNASLNIMLRHPTNPGQPAYEHYRKPIDGITMANGTNYEYVEVTVYGAIETLFPVQWNSNTLTPNTTFLNAYCAMVIEK